jgi:hypothetical protein
MYRTRNAACLEGHRGFESHPLRHRLIFLRKIKPVLVGLPRQCTSRYTRAVHAPPPEATCRAFGDCRKWDWDAPP